MTPPIPIAPINKPDNMPHVKKENRAKVEVSKVRCTTPNLFGPSTTQVQCNYVPKSKHILSRIFFDLYIFLALAYDNNKK